MEKSNFYIITGGPGSGKTMLIEELKKRQYKTVPESGRTIIQNMKQIGAEHLLQERKDLFAELMLSWDMQAYNEIIQTLSLTFFDRGIPDVIGFLRLNDLSVPDHLATAAEKFRYNRTVFIAPPWKAIYKQDAERKQDWEEALNTYYAMHFVYASLGYEVFTLPCVDVSQRADFVLKMRKLSISKSALKRLRKYLTEKNIEYQKNVSSSGSVYFTFLNPELAKYIIRISNHPMSPMHPLMQSDKTVFNMGNHKYTDGDLNECFKWIDSLVD